MTIAQKNNLHASLMALAAFGLFSTHDVLIKILGSSYATFQILFFSVLLSFPLVMLMLMRDSAPGTLMPVHPWWTALRTGAVVMTASSAFYAFSALPLTQVYAIIFTAPLLITVLSIPVLGEKVGWHRWGAIILGLIGVFVVLQPGSAELGLGHLAALLAAIGSATASVIVRKIGKDERDAVLLLSPMMANFILMAIAMPFTYVPMPVEHIGWIGVMSVLAFAAGLLMIVAYKNGDATIVAPMQYSQILWAALFGSLFFAESPTIETWVGAGIINVSGLYILLRESLGSTSKNRPVLTTKSRAETGTSPRVSIIEQMTAPNPVAKPDET